MRAHTITTMIVAGVYALAIPASVSAEPYVNSGYATQTTGIDSNLSGEAAAVAAGHAHRTPGELGRWTGPREPALVSSSPASTSDGFDWTSAAVGAGAAMALVCLGGAGFLTVRRRTAVSRSAASMS